jgi:hypothetical protein
MVMILVFFFPVELPSWNCPPGLPLLFFSGVGAVFFFCRIISRSFSA